MLKSWKTSLSGITLILGGITSILKSINDGTPINFQVDIGLIISGIGLLFAKDNNVTGGTVKQNEEVTPK